jgi:hypothetical protein
MNWFKRQFVPDQLAKDVALLIRGRPHEWKPYYIGTGIYHLIHNSGLDIWVANSDWGVKVEKGRNRSDYGYCNMWANASQRHIWKAYRWWLKNHKTPPVNALEQEVRNLL